MITPRFTITQEDEFVYVRINIASLRFSMSAIEMVIEKNLFVFHISPYYLRLRFPHNLIDDERSRATYNSKSETVEIQIVKEVKGQFFEDLDVPTKLLARQRNTLATCTLDSSDKLPRTGPLIQEINESQSDRIGSLEEQGEAFNWEIEQKPTEIDDGILGTRYGFDNLYNKIMPVSIANGNDINELGEPEHTGPNDRVKQRLEKEKLKFDSEYYVSEYMTCKCGSGEEVEINGIREVLENIPPIIKQYLKWYKSTEDKNSTMPIVFSDREQAQMQNNLPHKNYLIDDPKALYITVLSILFGYVFEQMENDGTHNTESAWTVGRLVPQIAFLDQQLLLQEDIGTVSIIKAAVITGTRRSLCYPLHRNFDLSLKAWNFVYYLLRGGQKLVARCLLDVHEMFRFHDLYYIYNKILLDDLCSWFLSGSNENVIRSMAVELKKEINAISKDQIEFDIFAGFDETTGASTWENMTLKEMELIAEQQYRTGQCH